VSGADRGILYPARLPRFTRVPAPDRVARLVRWFWVPEWDIAPGRTSRQHLVGFPASNLVVEDGTDGPALVGLAGPGTRRSHRDLTGRGWAVGAQLLPAAVPAFTDDPALLLDRYVRLDHPDLLAAVQAAMATGPAGTRPERAADAFADWLVAHVPPPGPDALLANDLAELVDGDRTVVRVEDVAARLAVSVRTVQRLARRHVGVPPAAMIRRRRLQEAAERVRADPAADLATLAAELGYADHAHLSHDFRAVLGLAPTEYRRTHDPA
jgi:AraC-like DNA-binding protein